MKFDWEKLAIIGVNIMVGVLCWIALIMGVRLIVAFWGWIW